MGHIVWNRIKNGKTLEASKAANMLIETKDVYIIVLPTAKSSLPKVEAVKIAKADNHYGCGDRMGAHIFNIALASGLYCHYTPGYCFPIQFRGLWKEHRDEFLSYCGNYVEENNDELEGFVKSVYGTIDNPIDRFGIGWGSIWYTTDKEEANKVRNILTDYIKSRK